MSVPLPCGSGGDPVDPPKIVSAGGVTNHGAAVASLIAGNIHGVVSQLTAILSVVAADCTGAASDEWLADAANFVISDHSPGTPAVANVSIANTQSDDVFDSAMRSMVQNGIVVVVAAGNASRDSCTTSAAKVNYPTPYPGFIAVGATNTYGSATGYSNYGSCVDIWAPGGDASLGVATGSGVGYGTSLSAPEVAGAAIVILSRYPFWTPASVKSKLLSDSRWNWVIHQAHIPDDQTCAYRVCNNLGCTYYSFY